MIEFSSEVAGYILKLKYTFMTLDIEDIINADDVLCKVEIIFNFKYLQLCNDWELDYIHMRFLTGHDFSSKFLKYWHKLTR
jgi:CO dehydrogenase/acetyl-CoA synthase gamma subunit (corrinoid Fe-S protein)